MREMSGILMVIHYLSLGGLLLYGMHRLWMLSCWLEWRKRLSVENQAASPELAVHPGVTVQIPLYNEHRVAARIIDAAAVLDWPADRLDIQVLDDSDDETTKIVSARVDHWRSRGVDICVLRRRTRAGFKAGALAAGLGRANGEFVALFDSDFVPAPDFLKQTIPSFRDPQVGMVQTRWGFLNAGYSWLTRLQSLLLAPHFAIEHQVRFRRRLFFNFNGTAGVWRLKTIIASGGWQSDTLTEDLDLSYRAQLKGWRFVYLDHVVVPSELPIRLIDFRIQQARWCKGSIQTARKLIPAIVGARLPTSVKIEACVHLLANLCWVFGFLVTVTLVPMLVIRTGIGPWQILRVDLPLFLFSGGAILFYYFMHMVGTRSFTGWTGLLVLPALSIGLAPILSGAVLKGLLVKGGTFRRTPKAGSCRRSPSIADDLAGLPRSLDAVMLNLVLLAYTLIPLQVAWQRHTWPAIPFLCLFPSGFALVALTELRERSILTIRR